MDDDWVWIQSQPIDQPLGSYGIIHHIPVFRVKFQSLRPSSLMTALRLLHSMHGLPFV